MRLSERHRKIISEMESDGYVWLSHLPINAQMRFRNKTKNGFKGYLKIEGLTFMTERVAQTIKEGTTKRKADKRPTYREQLKAAEQRIVDLEAELYRLKGVGARHEKLKYEAE